MSVLGSLDRDLKKVRLAKYTTQDSTELKEWISDVLGVALPGERDLMECLKDGVLLCRLINLLPSVPQLKPKASSMPFVQMEQIAAFLNAVSKPPVNLPTHDLFLTVDLYEQKDPAQVAQCLTAFSRIANKLAPDAFRYVAGSKKSGSGLNSPPLGAAKLPTRRDYSAGSNISGYSANSTTTISSASLSPTAAAPVFPPVSPPPAYVQPVLAPLKKTPAPPPIKPSAPVSSWSKREDKTKTAPAWNIHQYGYMGGASQGTMGVSFGGRRQITGTAVSVPNLRDKAEQRRKQDEEAARATAEAKMKEEVERLRQIKQEEEEEKRRWDMEEAKLQKAEEEARRTREEEAEKRRRWQEKKDEERELRRRDEAAQMKLDQEKADREKERMRIRELERELEKAREREKTYMMEQEQRRRQEVERRRIEDAEWLKNRSASSFLSTGASALRPHKTGTQPPTPLPFGIAAHKTGGATNSIATHRTGGSGRPFATPASSTLTAPSFLEDRNGRKSPRPLTPNKTGDRSTGRPISPLGSLSSPTPIENTTSPPPRALPTPPKNKPAFPLGDTTATSPTRPRFAWQRPSVPVQTATQPAREERKNSWEHDTATVIDVPTSPNTLARKAEEEQRQRAFKWANMSFLEREMELERQRQKEWERNQLEVESKAAYGEDEGKLGYGGMVGDSGVGWDIHQYGYMGGANQGTEGVAFGAKRQIIGPRTK